ncbi:hypothetical protein LTR36_005079 [Oleoguttula mirabilis]|uniref:F-box domain-containing protein n=1 Tax=Oleoguttula mirabilis TaxID=1507867 RepID=A0AAV9JXC2_9PEZI|nr:hypothetical protein LTR36_005079 [Oleoguttula mirabilis]
MAEQPFRFMDLPSELRIEILGYLLRQGDIITVNDDRVSSHRRRWNKEIARLTGRKWQPAKADPSPEVLRTCPQMSWDGMKTYWGGNQFAFGRYDLLQWFIEDCPRAPGSITSIVFGEDDHIDKSSAQPRPRESLMDRWPPSLALLENLPKLRKLELNVYGLKAHDGPRNFEAIWGKGGIDMPRCLEHPDDDRLASYYTRDVLLMSIPGAVLDRLTSLTTRHYTRTGTPMVLRDVLQYAKDLHRGAWKVCPYETRDKDSGRWIPIDGDGLGKAQMWREARAAVYWDDGMPEYRTQRRAQWTQWCTWSNSSAWCEGLSGDYQAPRRWAELFDEDGGVRAGVT